MLHAEICYLLCISDGDRPLLLLLSLRVIAPACVFVCVCSLDALHYVPLAHKFHWLQRDTTFHTFRKKKKTNSFLLKPVRPVIKQTLHWLSLPFLSELRGPLTLG